MKHALSEADPSKAETKPDGWHPLPKWSDEPVFDGLFIDGGLAGTVRFSNGRWRAKGPSVSLEFDTQAAAVLWCEHRTGYRQPTPAELAADTDFDAALRDDGWRPMDGPSGPWLSYEISRVWWLSWDSRRPMIAHMNWLGEVSEYGDHAPWFWKPIGERSAAHIAAGADGIRAGQVWGDARGVNWRIRYVDRDGPDSVAVLEPINLTEPAPDERVRADTVAEIYTLLSDAWAALAREANSATV